MSRRDAQSTGARAPRRSGGVDGDLKAPSSARTRAAARGGQVATLLRTGAAAVRQLHSVVQRQLEEMRTRLNSSDHGMPTVKLDPARIRATKWGRRHESTFQSRAFQRFKELILREGGNVQAILVRKGSDGGYEIVFGHRRHRACLELGLPVLAVVWQGDLPDAELFAAMHAENAGRQNPSAFDQGVAYAAAIGKKKLFTSPRQLAKAIGVSHTWVYKAISLFSSVTQSPRRSARGWVWARRPVFAGRCIAPERSSARVWSTAAR